MTSIGGVLAGLTGSEGKDSGLQGLASEFMGSLTAGATARLDPPAACPAPAQAPLVAISPRDSDDVNERIDMCANRLNEMMRVFRNFMSDLRGAIKQHGSLEEVLDITQPLFDGGPTPKEYARELIDNLKALMRGFDDSRCPEFISPYGREEYYKLKNGVNQIDRALKGAGGMNFDLGRAVEDVGRVLTTLLSIMRSQSPSLAH